MNTNPPANLPENITSSPPITPQAQLEIQKMQLQAHEEELKRKKGFTKAYVLSLFLPPIGLYYFIKFVFFGDGTTEDIRGGLLSLAITIASLAINIWIIAYSLKQLGQLGGGNNSQQFLQELITPANQNDLKKLLQ